MGDRFLRRLATFGLLAMVAACGTSEVAVDVDQKQAAESAAYFAGDFACTRADAVKVAFGALEANVAAYTDKCVQTEMFSDGARLYASGLVRDMDRRSAAWHQRMGAAWKDKDMPRRLSLGPSFVAITGRVRDCPAYRAKEAEAKALEAKVGHAVAPTEDRCVARATVYVSEAAVVPTAMD